MVEMHGVTPRTDEDDDAIEHLLQHEDEFLTGWEVEFLESISEAAVFTEKQRATFDKIWNEVVVERRRRRR